MALDLKELCSAGDSSSIAGRKTDSVTTSGKKFNRSKSVLDELIPTKSPAHKFVRRPGAVTGEKPARKLADSAKANAMALKANKPVSTKSLSKASKKVADGSKPQTYTPSAAPSVHKTPTPPTVVGDKEKKFTYTVSGKVSDATLLHIANLPRTERRKFYASLTDSDRRDVLARVKAIKDANETESLLYRLGQALDSYILVGSDSGKEVIADYADNKIFTPAEKDVLDGVLSGSLSSVEDSALESLKGKFRSAGVIVPPFDLLKDAVERKAIFNTGHKLVKDSKVHMFMDSRASARTSLLLAKRLQTVPGWYAGKNINYFKKAVYDSVLGQYPTLRALVKADDAALDEIFPDGLPEDEPEIPTDGHESQDDNRTPIGFESAEPLVQLAMALDQFASSGSTELLAQINGEAIDRESFVEEYPEEEPVLDACMHLAYGLTGRILDDTSFGKDTDLEDITKKVQEQIKGDLIEEASQELVKDIEEGKDGWQELEMDSATKIRKLKKAFRDAAYVIKPFSVAPTNPVSEAMHVAEPTLNQFEYYSVVDSKRVSRTVFNIARTFKDSTNYSLPFESVEVDESGVKAKCGGIATSWVSMEPVEKITGAVSDAKDSASISKLLRNHCVPVRDFVKAAIMTNNLCVVDTAFYKRKLQDNYYVTPLLPNANSVPQLVSSPELEQYINAQITECPNDTLGFMLAATEESMDLPEPKDVPNAQGFSEEIVVPVVGDSCRLKVRCFTFNQK